MIGGESCFAVADEVGTDAVVSIFTGTFIICIEGNVEWRNDFSKRTLALDSSNAQKT
jgi:hypothetical protein